LSFQVNRKTQILENLSVSFSPGSFVAVLGENGAGKILVDGSIPHEDPWALRQRIVYMSEKIDLPGDWSVNEFLEFNRFFYNPVRSFAFWVADTLEAS
jgi:ABC-type multidrug transport system ATPase subunit